MNHEGKGLIEKVSSVHLSTAEYQKQLLFTKNMSMLCHMSHSMNPVMLRYLSANNMVLQENGNYFLLLITDISDNGLTDFDGKELFSMAYVYIPVREIVGQTFIGHYMYYDAEIDHHLAVLLCFPHGMSQKDHDGFFEEFIAKDCKKIALRCKEEYDIDLVIYQSGVIDGIQSISLKYRHLLNYDVYRHFIGIEKESPYVTLPDFTSKAMITHQLNAYAKELVTTILNFEDSLSYAQEILDKLNSFPIISIDDLTTHFGSFMDFLTHELIDNGIPLYIESFYETLPVILNESLFWSDITDWFFSWLDETISRYHRKYQSDVFQRFENVKLFIEENYTNPDINVTYIADRFNINQAFLSTTFKKQYKVSVSAFIQSLRLNKAEELLKQSEAPIKTIYEQCGFSSAETFYRNFKKQFGITPNRVRN